MKGKLDIDKWMGTLPLQGEIVLVRPFVENDLSNEYVSWLNDPEIVRFSNQRFLDHDLVSARRYFDSFSGSVNAFFAIEDFQTKQHVGTITLYVQPYHSTVDVGILIGRRGNGYGSDAWCTVIDWLLNICQARKVTAGTLSCNYSMISLMKKAGMQHEATRRDHELIEGEPQDIVYFAKFHDK